jgi:hypothetical protein
MNLTESDYFPYTKTLCPEIYSAPTHECAALKYQDEMYHDMIRLYQVFRAGEMLNSTAILVTVSTWQGRGVSF